MEVTLNNVLSTDSLYSIISDKYPGIKKNDGYLSLVYDGVLLNISHKKDCLYEVDRDVPLIKFFFIGSAILLAWIFIVVGAAPLISKLDISFSPEVMQYLSKIILGTIIIVPVAIYKTLWKMYVAKGNPSVLSLSNELVSICNTDTSQKFLDNSAPAVLEDIKTKAIKKRLKKLIISAVVSIALFLISRTTTGRDMWLSFAIIVGMYSIYCVVRLIILKLKKD